MSAADDEQWLLLGPAQEAEWRRSHLLDGKERLLGWADEPPAEVRALRVVTASGDPDTLPPMVPRLPGLAWLELPRAMVRGLGAGDLPDSLVTLRLTGEGRVTWPRAVVHPGVRRFASLGGEVALTFANLPALEALTLRLDSKGAGVRLVGEYPGLIELGATNVHTDDVVVAAPATLRVLALSGGRLASLGSVARLPELTRLVVNNCAALTSLDGVQELARLEELEVAHCEQLTDLEVVAGLPALRRVSVIGCRNVDRGRLRALFGATDLSVVG